MVMVMVDGSFGGDERVGEKMEKVPGYLEKSSEVVRLSRCQADKKNTVVLEIGIFAR